MTLADVEGQIGSVRTRLYDSHLNVFIEGREFATMTIYKPAAGYFGVSTISGYRSVPQESIVAFVQGIIFALS